MRLLRALKIVSLLGFFCGSATAAHQADADLIEVVRSLKPEVMDAGERDSLAEMLARDVRERLKQANRDSTSAWREIDSREEWEQFSHERLRRLRESFGTFPSFPGELKPRITRKVGGPGFQIEMVVYESRPDLLVTGNLYSPSEPGEKMPGILICPSHHNPKTQSELQDMGIMWARRGCVVLVIDLPGHGERRDHTFHTPGDYAGGFRPDRQDYYFRHNLGLQLQLAGESLIGWFAWDLMRGVDLLLSRPGVDPERIILLGSVAGGGDPAAVTAALDQRIACVVPFNFGGPQPENRYPLPADAEETFPYAGSGSWETTRNLRLSARDGFLPWVIVGSTAPRFLIYAHEFNWDRERDPVWPRLQTIYGWYGAQDRLDFTHGFGLVTLRPPEASHCNNIGPVQRRRIHQALERWFGIEPPEEEFRARRDASELLCLPGSGIRPVPIHRVAARLAEQRRRRTEERLSSMRPSDTREHLRQTWSRLLGENDPETEAAVESVRHEQDAGMHVERFVVRAEREICVPVLLLRLAGSDPRPQPAVIGIAQSGKAAFLKHRAETIAQLLKAGVTVCLPDVRGTGETAPPGDRGRRSAATSIASSEQMLGQTLVGSRLKDLRTILAVLRQRGDVDPRRIGLWGDSFAPANAVDRNLRVPLDAADSPENSEPLGHLLALLGGLYEEEIAAVASAAGGLVNYRSLLESPFCYMPYDAVVPGAIPGGDLDHVAAALVPRPVWIAGLVDGRNVPAPPEHARALLYRIESSARQASQTVQLHDASDRDALARWLIEHLRP